MKLRHTTGAVLLTAALLTGCLADESCQEAASASCAAGVEYQDHFYVAWSAKLPVVRGERLGDAIRPVCDDGGGCVDQEAVRHTTVWAMRGVDPGQVVIAREEGTGRLVVHGRLHADPEDYFTFSDGTWHVDR